ncbi:MAG: SPFH domain-containing protein [Cyanobacteria bacterium J06642_12]
MGAVLAILIALGASTGAGLLIIRNLYYICQPSEVLIFAGGKRRTATGRNIGYRLVKGGSSLRTPLLERAFRMDITNSIIELKVSNAYSKGGIPLNVTGVANIKIAGEEPTIHNAIERLLGKNRQEIEKIARETLEGNLRGVLASLTPEQVNEDKIAFAKSLLEEAEDDLERLGLVLDTLQVQNISDDVGYLNSIGRKQQVELRRDARIAEAETKAESAVQSSENEKITALKRIERDEAISRAEADRRIQNALTQRTAVIAEAEADIAAEVARAEADIPVQQELIKQVEQQLQADVVAPAEADCKQAIARAQARASKIVENGRAQAEGTRRLVQSWQAAGPLARDVFLLQKLDVLLELLAGTVPEVHVDNVTVIDPSNTGAVGSLISAFEQVKYSTGIDVPAAAQKLVRGDRSTPAPSPPVTSEMVRELKGELQQIMDRASTTTTSNAPPEEVVTALIDRQPGLRNKLKRVLKAGGDAALDTLFDHPVVSISNRMVDEWLQDS